MKQIIGPLLFLAGIIVASGSANDCDGACMDQANTIGEMLMVAGVGVALMLAGFVMLIKNQHFE